jgi:diguanylate cyclase (GGDEF)-like protein/PAS domain S-box-containing protein
MDVRTLFVTIGLVYGILAVLLLVSERPRWGSPAAMLAVAYALGSAGVLLQAGRDLLPAGVSLGIGNLLAWLGLQGQAWAAVAMSGRSVRPGAPLVVAGSTVAFGIVAVLTPPVTRTVLSLSMYAACFALTTAALLAWRNAPRMLRDSAAAILALLAAIYGARAVAVATGVLAPDPLAAGGQLDNRLFYTVAFAGVVGSAFGLILLAKRAAEQSLGEALRENETILGTLTTGVAILDADRVVHVNPALAAMLDTVPADLEGQRAATMFPSVDHYDDWRRQQAAALADDGRHSGEVQLARRGGRTLWAWTQSTALNRHDGHSRVVVAVTDITTWKAEQGELLSLASTDELTGLLNRRSFLERATVELSRTDRTGRPTCIALVDLDHLKTINDDLGHAAGDQALATLARACTAGLRDLDVVARLGGDEFAVVLPDTTLAQGGDVMERVLAMLRTAQPDLTMGGVRVAASVGVAQYSPPGSLETVLARADGAMYAAKGAGRDAVCLQQRLQPDGGVEGP